MLSSGKIQGINIVTAEVITRIQRCYHQAVEMETNRLERGCRIIVHRVGVVVRVAKYSRHGLADSQKSNCYLLSEP